MSIFSFFKAFFLSPRNTGAILPSSKYLANCIANCVQLSESGIVLELGAGTGVITQSLLAAHIPADKIMVIEKAEHLTQNLKKKFPNIEIIQEDATRLTQLLKNNSRSIDSVVSSLPLRSLHKTDRDSILSQIPNILSPQGQFIQFTYDLRNNIDFYPNHFRVTHSFIVWWNLPPARVTVFKID